MTLLLLAAGCTEVSEPLDASQSAAEPGLSPVITSTNAGANPLPNNRLPRRRCSRLLQQQKCPVKPRPPSPGMKACLPAYLLMCCLYTVRHVMTDPPACFSTGQASLWLSLLSSDLPPGGGRAIRTTGARRYRQQITLESLSPGVEYRAIVVFKGWRWSLPTASLFG